MSKLFIVFEINNNELHFTVDVDERKFNSIGKKLKRFKYLHDEKNNDQKIK